MSDRWVLNASPLIVFGKIGRLELFSQLAAEIVVPRGVAQEILAGIVSSGRWKLSFALRLFASLR